MGLAMNSVYKIKVVFKFKKKKKKKMLTWIKPQKSFAEAGVRTRSSLSMCQ